MKDLFNMSSSPNIILQNLQKIPDIQNQLFGYLNNIISQEENKLLDTKTHQAILKSSDTAHYLFVKRLEGITVYYQHSQGVSKPFSYANIEQNSIYYDKVIQIPDQQYLDDQIAIVNEEFHKSVEKSAKPENEKNINKMQELVIKMKKNEILHKQNFEVTNSLYGLINFFNQFGIPSVLSDYAKTQKDGLNSLIKIEADEQVDVPIVENKLNRLFDACVQNKFTTKNKYEFNDLDNHVWIQSGKLHFSTQNFHFIAEKNHDGWDSYVTPRDSDIQKKTMTTKALLQAIDSQSVNMIENGVLSTKKNKVVFNDPYVSQIMMDSVVYSLDALESEKIIEKEIAPGNKLLTADEYVVKSIHQYPTLYLKYSYEQSKIAVFDHVFNTIGSGSSDFLNMIEGKPIAFENIEAWFGDSKIYSEESSRRSTKSKVILNPSKEDVKNDTFIFEIKKDPSYYHIPYPNFQKKYSIIYSDNYQFMDDTWKKAALDFYKYSKEFFADDNKSKFFHYAFSIDSLQPPIKDENTNYKKMLQLHNQSVNLVRDLKERFEGQTNEQISKDYGTEFIGNNQDDNDIAKFLVLRWKKEKQKIQSFIDGAISMIETDLNKNKKPKP